MRAKVWYIANDKRECCDVVFPHGIMPRKGEWLKLEGATMDYTYVIHNVIYIVRGSNGEPIDDICYDVEIVLGKAFNRTERKKPSSGGPDEGL